MRYVPLLSPAQIALAARHTHPFWGDGRSLSAHVAHTFAQLEAAGPELLRYVGLVERGRLLGSIKRYSLLLREGDAPVMRAVGIGAVFTPPRARGRGVASTLLRAVLQEARDLGYEAAQLYSDIDPAFYARLGFVALRARDFAIDVAALPSRGALDVRRARADEVDRVLDFYEAAWRSEGPTVLRHARTPAIFRYFCRRNGVGPVWILRHRGRDAGYLMAGPDDPARDLPARDEDHVFWFDEAAAPGVPCDRVWATVRALATRARARRVRGWVGPAGVPTGADQSRRQGAAAMIAPLGELRVRPRRAWLDSFQHY
jgi:GNAT superfamily N-acetyltransferase